MSICIRSARLNLSRPRRTVDTDVHADAINPCPHVAAPLKVRPTAPQVDKTLLEEVGHLVLVFAEHVADCVDGCLVRPHHLFKFLFMMVHYIDVFVQL